MTGTNTRLSRDPDWIERLRARLVTRSSYRTHEKMTLMCDVLEAAQPMHGINDQLARALAALRDEVERDVL